MNGPSIPLQTRLRRFIASTSPLLVTVARQLRIALKDKFYKQAFQTIYENNTWADPHSHSGQGSNLQSTEAIRKALPPLIKEFKINSMLDIPCGDLFWMKEVELQLDYIGGDIVPALVARNQELYSHQRRRFALLDIIGDPLPRVDLIFCRDCLVHFSFHSILRALDNMRSSDSRYLLTTTFTERKSHLDIATGNWRPINLQLSPFNLPPPLFLIDEECPLDGYRDKSLGLWKID
jgi:SAM-dependent methyltransferase